MARPTAIENLYSIIEDGSVAMRQRLNAAVSASRVEPLAMPGEDEPAAVRFLRNIISFRYEGKAYRPEWRRESAAALAYYERRAKKAELLYNVSDQAERQARWRQFLNGLIRAHLWKHGRWPQDRHLLFTSTDTIATPSPEPDLAISAILIGGERQRPRRRQRAIDEPTTPWIASEAERLEVLRPVARIIHERVSAPNTLTAL